MCGIAGILMLQGHADWARMRRALAGIAHRGPNGEGLLGVTADGAVTDVENDETRLLLGFRRLAILDLLTRADQPMRCPRTGNLIIFNGEIYNFLELRAELETLGHVFCTSGDTEMILAAYLEWGVEAFRRFNGMWAIALYDAQSGDLLLCRDRMGVKPLYFTSDGARIVFGSEIRSLITLLGELPPVNRAAAFDFLAGIKIDHTDATLFDGIINVPSGGLWRITAHGDVTRGRYHNWPEGEDERHTPEQLRELFTDSVRLRLRSDAPTVSLLSGGVDSSITTWVAATQNRLTPRTKFVGAFSYGYDDAAYARHDEIARAEALVAALPEPIDHHIVRMSPHPALDELLDLTVTQELPCTTPSIVASYRLYQHIRDAGIKVAISGEGADELFAGYTRRYMPQLARDAFYHGDVRQVATLLASPHLSLKGLINRMGWALPSSVMQTMLRAIRPNVSTLTADFWATHRHQFDALVAAHRVPLEACLRSDVIRSAMPVILRYADRNSMAASVEVRLPFMDYRLVEFALTTPMAQKINANGGKQILREAFRGIVPDAVIAQPKNMGFGNAEQYEVLNLALAPLLERAPAEAWHYIDRAALTAQLQKTTTHPTIWLPISFLLWMTARHENRFTI